MKIVLTQKKWRRVTALVAGLAAILLFVLLPGALLSGVFPFPVTPVFTLLGIACLLFEVRTAPLLLRVAAKLLLFALCVFMLLYATEVTVGGSFERLSSFLYMYALLLAMGGLLYALCGSLPWAVRVLAIPVALYSAVNYFVLQFRGNPFIPLDLFSLKTALGVLPNYTMVFTAPLAELVLIVLAIFFVCPKLALPAARLGVRIPIRAASGILAIALFVSTINTDYYVARDYTPHFWDQNVSAKQNGAALNFIANLAYSVVKKPDSYSLNMASGIAGGYPSDSVDSAGVKPDIVLVMGEGWSDMAPKETTQTNIPVTPFMDDFGSLENGLRRDLVVSSYGGGTSFSEFQVLAGVNATYGIHQSPFQFNVSDPVPNLVSVLKQLGYTTTAMHTGSPSAWNRDKAFPLLGFDQFYSAEDIEQEDSTYTRYYLSDKCLYDKALSVLDSSDEPQFVYAITIQTHGGFVNETYDSPVQIESPSGSYPMAEQYLGLMHESDEDFAAFIAALEQRERPTLVLAYGDHRPALEEAYVDQVAVGDKDIWLNQTFYVMWANYPLPEATEQTPPVLGLSYLGPKLMQAAQLPLTGYQKFLLEGMEHYPAISYEVFYDANGDIFSNDVIDMTYYVDQAVMQYNLVYDTKNRVPDFFVLSE